MYIGRVFGYSRQFGNSRHIYHTVIPDSSVILDTFTAHESVPNLPQERSCF